MSIEYLSEVREFHLYNAGMSYIIQILDNGKLSNLYIGKRIQTQQDYTYLLQGGHRSLAVYNQINEYVISPQYTKLEYPDFGTGDFRCPAIEVLQQDGSRITNFTYKAHTIIQGKKKLEGLPATYVESDEEAMSLEITMYDELLNLECILSYTLYETLPVLTRNVLIRNEGEQAVVLERVMSAAYDFPDKNFTMIQLSGAWARERHIKIRELQQGLQGIQSMRGASSAEHTPFIALARPNTQEDYGEVFGFSLVYSGNHLEQIEVDTNDMTRVILGIHPDTFEWKLESGEVFQSPEAVLVYSDQGFHKMSQTFHQVYRTRLARGWWRDRERPILINNWEATGAQFTEEKILEIAKAGKKLGMELFVLDDGWFGGRDNDKKGLGDWYVTDYMKLPHGIVGLAEQIEKLGMMFGLWFEPEMVNMDSDLYRAHPDWILCAPGRSPSPSRNQYTLDFSRNEVIDYIYEQMASLLSKAKIHYVKWDMNRYITECYSAALPYDEQGKVYHRYILGVYSLYERLINAFPEVLFESCSSGGARFDPGMLYYAPQTWTSDDTDAMERIKIQYGTSLVYPLSSMGAHVSESPNQQVGRITSMETRANVAMFGVFGYELDLTVLTTEEKAQIQNQIQVVKQHRALVQNGEFYRLQNPFEEQAAAWMVVSDDKSEALLGYYQIHSQPNGPWRRVYLKGLLEKEQYLVGNQSRVYYGDELMYAGLLINGDEFGVQRGDYISFVVYIRKK